MLTHSSLYCVNLALQVKVDWSIKGLDSQYLDRREVGRIEVPRLGLRAETTQEEGRGEKTERERMQRKYMA